jgi:hypothetical protein
MLNRKAAKTQRGTQRNFLGILPKEIPYRSLCLCDFVVNSFLCVSLCALCSLRLISYSSSGEAMRPRMAEAAAMAGFAR